MGTKGSPLPLEVKQIIPQIKQYFDLLKTKPEEADLPSVERVARALGIGVASVRRVMADYNKNPDFLQQPGSHRGKPEYAVSDNCQPIVRSYIRTANRNGNYITLDMLHDFLQKEVGDQDYNVRSLGRALDRWGFTFGKGKRSANLKEKDYVVAARRRYLREKISNRKEANSEYRTEVYLDESYINKNHSNDYTWYSDEDGPWLKKPTGKGERLIILNAITRAGWVPEAKLVFKSTKKTGDYHGQMNYDLFSKWFEEKLIPNIPENSLIIMDNAAYHNVLSECSAPTASCKKDKIKSWLKSNNIPLSDDCLKVELVELLHKIGPSPTYAIDKIAQKYGHDILRTPQYHPELQPIETCWAIVKNEAAINCDFTLKNLMLQLDKAFEKVSAKTCTGLIKKVRKVEDDFWESDDSLYD